MPAKPKRGEVVLVPFPFADLAATKVRPAVIVSGSVYHRTEPDLILVTITSQISGSQQPTDYLLQDWKEAGLLAPSVVKVSLATLEPAMVRHRLGRLTARDLREMEGRVKLALEL